ncbi:hypothetical protein D0859_02769 [Hortaea werneckii]|uniref:Rhodopsin domain-containing protein n=1 Tax=Hortaea werneckii TaxID=91943 RepID=A0A3M7J5R7_HORWE|nr:hypothetical protein D0859_02769 [Hortaea werneckii]
MEDRGPTIVTLLVVFTIVSALFIAARLFVRIKLLRNLGADDYLITLAWICAIINTGISARATHWGSGRHFDDLSPAQKSKHPFDRDPEARRRGAADETAGADAMASDHDVDGGGADESAVVRVRDNSVCAVSAGEVTMEF